jgi:hypothetical protein
MAAILKWFVWLYGHCIGMRVARGNGDLWTDVTVILPSRLMSASKQATTWLAWVNPAEYWGIYFLFNYILTLKIVIFYGLTILRWMTVVSVKNKVYERPHSDMLPSNFSEEISWRVMMGTTWSGLCGVCSEGGSLCQFTTDPKKTSCDDPK